jgi:hypothetical protein
MIARNDLEESGRGIFLEGLRKTMTNRSDARWRPRRNKNLMPL